MKKVLAFLVLFTFMIASVSLTGVSAKGHESSSQQSSAEQEIIFEGTITVDNSNSKYDIGFVTITFMKNFISEELYPVTFDVKLYAEDGLVYIEFGPDMDGFLKSVKIHTHQYNGFLYDVSTEENIYVQVPNQVFRVDHFSRYCIAW